MAGLANMKIKSEGAPKLLATSSAAAYKYTSIGKY
jgi:hypothetical protein